VLVAIDRAVVAGERLDTKLLIGHNTRNLTSIVMEAVADLLLALELRTTVGAAIMDEIMTQEATIGILTLVARRQVNAINEVHLKVMRRVRELINSFIQTPSLQGPRKEHRPRLEVNRPVSHKWQQSSCRLANRSLK
jgi:hypothetical protein